tara:strand:+ start:7209 stop:7508 length:300 start_codon:yes stop_codon:yes gene_type:complete
MENQEAVVIILGIMVIILCVVFSERGKSRKKAKAKVPTKPTKQELDQKYSELSKMKVVELKTIVLKTKTDERLPTKKKDLIELALKDFNEKFDTKDWKG